MVSVRLVIVLLGMTSGGHAQVRGQVGATGTTPQQGLRQLVRFRSSYGNAWRRPTPPISLRTAGLGGCPPVPSGLYCPRPPPDDCGQDSDCPLGQLCCRKDCNRQCTEAARPGRCPSSEAELEERDALLRELVPCRPSRPEQLECPTALKCCQLAGNHFCLPPVPEITAAIQAAVAAEDEVLSTKAGFCPPPSFIDDFRPPCRGSSRVNVCDADDHCPGPKKCCPSLCSRQCVLPLIEYR